MQKVAIPSRGPRPWPSAGRVAGRRPPRPTSRTLVSHLTPGLWEAVWGFSFHQLYRTNGAWLWGLWTHFKAPFTGFFSSVHQVPSPTCSWPGSTRSLWGEVLPIFPDMAPKTTWLIMLLGWDQLLEAYTRGASAWESILEKGTHITPLYSWI